MWVTRWLCLVFLSQGCTTLLSNWGGKLHMESVTSEGARSVCPGDFSKDIFFLWASDSICSDRIADSLYFLCVYQNVFHMLTWQNYKSQNKQMTNSRVYFNLDQLVAAESVRTERRIAFQSCAWARGIHWDGEDPSFPTESCASLKAWDWIVLIMEIVCCRSESLQVSWGYGKQFSFFLSCSQPKDSTENKECLQSAESLFRII